MPRVTITSPAGLNYRIDTRNEQTLEAWFDEVLPHAHMSRAIIRGRPEAEVLWPRIYVQPLPAWDGDAAAWDWLSDTRAWSTASEFPAADGASGMRELARLRTRLQAELEAWDGAHGAV